MFPLGRKLCKRGTPEFASFPEHLSKGKGSDETRRWMRMDKEGPCFLAEACFLCFALFQDGNDTENDVPERGGA